MKATAAALVSFQSCPLPYTVKYVSLSQVHGSPSASPGASPGNQFNQCSIQKPVYRDFLGPRNQYYQSLLFLLLPTKQSNEASVISNIKALETVLMSLKGHWVRENRRLQLEVSLRVRGERWVFCSLFIYFLLCFLDATKYLLK